MGTDHRIKGQRVVVRCCYGACFGIGFVVSTVLLTAMFWLVWFYFGFSILQVSNCQRRAIVDYSNTASSTSSPVRNTPSEIPESSVNQISRFATATSSFPKNDPSLILDKRKEFDHERVSNTAKGDFANRQKSNRTSIQETSLKNTSIDENQSDIVKNFNKSLNQGDERIQSRLISSSLPHEQSVSNVRGGGSSSLPVNNNSGRGRGTVSTSQPNSPSETILKENSDVKQYDNVGSTFSNANPAGRDLSEFADPEFIRDSTLGRGADEVRRGYDDRDIRRRNVDRASDEKLPKGDSRVFLDSKTPDQISLLDSERQQDKAGSDRNSGSNGRRRGDADKYDDKTSYEDRYQDDRKRYSGDSYSSVGSPREDRYRDRVLEEERDSRDSRRGDADRYRDDPPREYRTRDRSSYDYEQPEERKRDDIDRLDDRGLRGSRIQDRHLTDERIKDENERRPQIRSDRIPIGDDYYSKYLGDSIKKYDDKTNGTYDREARFRDKLPNDEYRDEGRKTMYDDRYKSTDYDKNTRDDRYRYRDTKSEERDRFDRDMVRDDERYRSEDRDDGRYRPRTRDILRDDEEYRSRDRDIGKDDDGYRTRDRDTDKFRPRDRDDDSYRPRDTDNDRYSPKDRDDDRYRARDTDDDKYRARDRDDARYRPSDRYDDRYRPRDRDDARYRPRDRDDDRYRLRVRDEDIYKLEDRDIGRDDDRYRSRDQIRDRKEDGLKTRDNTRIDDRFIDRRGDTAPSTKYDTKEDRIRDDEDKYRSALRPSDRDYLMSSRSDYSSNTGRTRLFRPDYSTRNDQRYLKSETEVRDHSKSYSSDVTTEPKRDIMSTRKDAISEDRYRSEYRDDILDRPLYNSERDRISPTRVIRDPYVTRQRDDRYIPDSPKNQDRTLYQDDRSRDGVIDSRYSYEDRSKVPADIDSRSYSSEEDEREDAKSRSRTSTRNINSRPSDDRKRDDQYKNYGSEFDDRNHRRNRQTDYDKTSTRYRDDDGGGYSRLPDRNSDFPDRDAINHDRYDFRDRDARTVEEDRYGRDRDWYADDRRYETRLSRRPQSFNPSIDANKNIDRDASSSSTYENKELINSRFQPDTNNESSRPSNQSSATYPKVAIPSISNRDSDHYLATTSTLIATRLPHDSDSVKKNLPDASTIDNNRRTSLKEVGYSGSETYNTRNYGHDQPLSAKDVIEAALRHNGEHEENAKKVHYPVFDPRISNLTSPDIIRPSERKGITISSKKRK